MSEIAKLSGEAVDAEALKKAEEFIEEEEGRTNKLRGWLGVFVTAVAIVMSLFHLYSAYAIVPTQVMRPVHVAFVLFLAIKGLTALQKQEAAKPVEPQKPSAEVELLTEIRDLLKKT